MSDAICGKCQEPWELYYLGHEAMYDYPGDNAPEHIHDAHANFIAAIDEHEAGNAPAVDHYRIAGQLLTAAVMRGEGCPACWDRPERATANADDQLEALRHNLFDSGWDGDPAELF